MITKKFGVSDYAASNAFFVEALKPLGVVAGAEGASTDCDALLLRYQAKQMHLARWRHYEPGKSTSSFERSVPLRFQGRIVDWQDEKGFGFVSPNGRDERAFLHIKAFTRRGRRPVGNELVTFTMARDAKGRLRAEQVAFVVLGTKPAPTRSARNWRVILAMLFLLAVAAMWAASRIPIEILGIYVVASAIVFVLYAFDKSAARRGDWRTPESWLQLLSLIGGWPGALFGQQLLQHKTRKASFQGTFWFAVAANLATLFFLLSSDGSKLLSELLAR